ncbi:PIN domain-containing protein [Cyclobacterium sp. SYSU L10401]|uniref:PIN domain-containing protein n=1 Tax=Cyclobacterium sp. SYSU L10401 TaxID=2678657 RepID=UPI0013D56DAA
MLARYKYRYWFTPIPENDIWIAAMAQEHGLPLVTRDAHFKYLPDLKILFW